MTDEELLAIEWHDYMWGWEAYVGPNMRRLWKELTPEMRQMLFEDAEEVEAERFMADPARDE